MVKTRRISLCGAWQFRRHGAGPDEPWLPARVPGVVQDDLLAAGLLDDPYVGTNEERAQWVGRTRWAYRRRFSGPPIPRGARAAIVMEGIDTLATVLLNGRAVGTADNMFIPWRFDVTDLLAAGGNELMVIFDTVEARAAAAARAYGVPLKNVARAPDGQFVRKAPCHFGWDWGPTLLTAGLWRPVWLEIVPRARIESIDAWGDPGDSGAAVIHLAAEADGPDAADLRLVVTATAPNGRQVGRAESPLIGGRAEVAIPVRRALLWWPNGMGDQPLYSLRAALSAGRRIVDEKTVRVGVRRLELVRQPDRFGRSFCFSVNGKPFFAKGANWIPADALPPRVTAARYRALIDSCADAGMNMLRVWGGGYYEDEAFYDRCDERGLLVWQDFMFACAMYPGDDAKFAENVRREAQSVVKRLRRRTCLALWCGNNEIESGWFEWGWNKQHPERVWLGYERLFHDILPKTVAALDPRRAYIPSSPTSAEVGKPNHPASGDCHFWSVWHGQGTHLAYLESDHRFVSEFGFQSLPSIETLGRVIPADERRLDSPSMLQHQKSGQGNDKIARAVELHLGRPRDFDSLIYMSQVYQAMAVCTGIEHWRRSAPRTMGALYWQANDCWPVLSWSSLDYHNRWKALHYAARRAFGRYLVSGLADGAGVRLWATVGFEGPAGTVELAWQVRSWLGERPGRPGRILARGRRRFNLESGQTSPPVELRWADLALASPQSAYVAAELRAAGKVVGRTLVPGDHLAGVRLPEPRLAVSVRGTGRKGGAPIVEVVASDVAVAVALEAPGVAGRFEDNFFDMLPGERRRVRFLPPPADGDRRRRNSRPGGGRRSLAEALRTAIRVRTLFGSRLSDV